MTFTDYLKYIRFACDEELERLGEYLWCIHNDVDQSGDKPYLCDPLSNCPPDLDEATQKLNGRDVAADFAVIDGTDEDARENLYAELRDLLLYS